MLETHDRVWTHIWWGEALVWYTGNTRGFWSETWVYVLVLKPASCVTFGKSLRFSQLKFLQVQHGEIAGVLWRLSNLGDRSSSTVPSIHLVFVTAVAVVTERFLQQQRSFFDTCWQECYIMVIVWIQVR